MHLEARSNSQDVRVFEVADPGERFRVELTDREARVNEIELLLLGPEKVRRIQEGDPSVQADVLRPDPEIHNKYIIPKGLGRVTFESARRSLVRTILGFEVEFVQNENT